MSCHAHVTFSGGNVTATTKLEAGAVLGPFEGEVMTREAFQTRLREYTPQDYVCVYPLTEELVVDATRTDSVIKFASHHYSPNAEISVRNVSGRDCLAVTAKKEIQAGETISLDLSPAMKLLRTSKRSIKRSEIRSPALRKSALGKARPKLGSAHDKTKKISIQGSAELTTRIAHLEDTIESKSLELEKFKRKSEDLSKELELKNDKLSKELEEATRKLIQYEEQISSQEKSLEESSGARESLSVEMEELRGRCSSLESELELKAGDLSSLNEEMTSKYALIEDLQSQLESSQETVQSSEADNQTQQSVISRLEAQNKYLTDEVSSKSRSLELLQSTLEALQSNAGQADSLSSEVVSLQDRLEAREEELSALQTEKAELTARITDLTAEARTREQQVQSLEERVEDLSQQDQLQLQHQAEQLESLRLALKEKSDLLAASQADQTLLARYEELTEELVLLRSRKK